MMKHKNRTDTLQNNVKTHVLIVLLSAMAAVSTAMLLPVPVRVCASETSAKTEEVAMTEEEQEKEAPCEEEQATEEDDVQEGGKPSAESRDKAPVPEEGAEAESVTTVEEEEFFTEETAEPPAAQETVAEDDQATEEGAEDCGALQDDLSVTEHTEGSSAEMPAGEALETVVCEDVNAAQETEENTPPAEELPAETKETSVETKEETSQVNDTETKKRDAEDASEENPDPASGTSFSEEITVKEATPYTTSSHTDTADAEKEAGTEVTVSQEKTEAALAKKTARKKTVKKSSASRKKTKKKKRSKRRKKLYDMKLEVVAFKGKNMGDAQMLSCRGKHLLIDTLAKDSWKLLKKWLKKHGYRKFDVYISHYHGDHCGNLLKLMGDKTFKISKLYLPDMKYMTGRSGYMKNYRNLCRAIVRKAKKKGIRIVYLKKGSSFKVGDVRANVLWGTSFKSRRHNKKYINNNSLVTKFSSQNITYLNAGDIEKEAEKKILKAGINLHTDIFKMNHHGVDTSNSKRFLRAVCASYYYYNYISDNSSKFSPSGSWSYRAVEDAKKYGNVTSLMYNGGTKDRTRMITYRVKNGVVVQDIGKNISKQKVYLYDKKKPRVLKRIMTLETNDASDFVLKSGMCPKYKGCKTIKKNTVRKKASIRKTSAKKKKKTSKKKNRRKRSPKRRK